MVVGITNTEVYILYTKFYLRDKPFPLNCKLKSFLVFWIKIYESCIYILF